MTSSRARASAAANATLVATVLITTVSLASVAAGRAYVRPTRAEVETALSAYEHVPSGDGLVQRFGPSVVDVLLDIVDNPTDAVLARNRALTALRVFATTKVKRALARAVARNRAAKTPQQRFLLAQALTSYAAASGPSSLAQVTKLLVHPHVDVRRAAAEALRLSRAKQARALLLERSRLDNSALMRHTALRQVLEIDRAAAAAAAAAAPKAR